MSDWQSVEIVFICPDSSEADALRAKLEVLEVQSGELVVDGLALNVELGAFKTTQIVTFVLVYASGVSQGVIGNAIFDALKSAPTSQCVIAGEPIDKSTVADKAKLEEKVRAKAQPRSGRKRDH